MPDQRPNLLFLYPDQMRYDWTEMVGFAPVKTPNLRRLASEGVDFRSAVTPSPLCAPARACLAAGKEYDQCRVPSNGENYPLDQTTVYTLLRGSDYHVMGCGKFDLAKADSHWGGDGKRLLDEWGFSDGIDNEGKWDGIGSYRRNGGPVGPHMTYLEEHGLAQAHLDDHERRRGSKGATFPTPLPEEAYCDNWIGQNGIDLLRAAPEDKPWFLQVNFNGPHDPWDITGRMEARWRGVEHPPPVDGDESLSPDQHNAVRQNYSAMVENIDRWVGIYLDELEARGELDNTLIVFSSDHGEMLGDHGGWAKGKPQQASIGVPLIVWGPGVQRNVVSDAPMTTLDLAATFLDYADLSVPDDMESRSLRPVLGGSTGTHREYVLSGLGEWRVVFDGRYKVTRYVDGREVVHDLASVSGECSAVVTQSEEVVSLAAVLGR